jgi:hypothetical protein
MRFTALIGLVSLTSLLGCDLVKKLTGSEAAPSALAAAPTAPLATAAAAGAVKTVAFERRVPKAGVKASVSRKTSSKFTMKGQTFRETSVSVSEFEVKESDEFRVTKASVEVKELYTTSQQGTGSEKKSVSPLEGSSYIVTRSDDGKLSALNSEGNKVDAATLKLIKDEFGNAFEKNQDAAFLPDRPLNLEEKLMPASDSMLSALGIKDDGNTMIDGTEFILKSSDPKANFVVSLTMTQKVAAANMRVRSKLKGNIEMLPAGAWITDVSLKGPLTILDGSGNEQGSGELSFSGSQTFH